MRRKLVFALILLNCVLGFCLLSRSAQSQILPNGLLDCCQGVGPDAYCCADCCWLTFNCIDDQGCRETQE